MFVIYIRDSIALRFEPFKRMYENGSKIALNIARNSEPLPPAKRDETLPYALFLFMGKCMEMIV